MRAAFGIAAGQIELRDVARPSPGPSDVLVRVRGCGICGSDLHWYHGVLPVPPVCPGHEISGEVAEVGADVRGVRAGDRVAIEPLTVCHACRSCRIGEYQLCATMRILGIGADGGFADYVVAPAYTVFPLPASLGWELGALTEPTAVCVHAVRLAGVQIGQRVLVLGAGAIGLLSAAAARAAGASEVLITARYPHQRAAAEALGARPFTATNDGLMELADAAQREPIDAVIETVGGSADTINDAVQLVRPGGTVVVLGVFSAPISCNGLLLVTKEVRIVGSIVYGRAGARADFDIALDLLATQRERLQALVTHRFPLERISEAFATAGDKQSGAIKVTIG
jgi:2-desacetyl-2-hydroxyethyl bacteriochlorophyllide A dehydrogenase